MVLSFVWLVAGGRSAGAEGVGGSRELLDLHGIDASQLNRFRDGKPIGASDEETLVRILQRFPRFPRHTLEGWSRPASEHWPQLASDPSGHRAEVFRLSGRVTRIERSPLLPEMASRLDFSEYFRVTLQLPEPSQVAILCSRRIPQAWMGVEAIDEAAEAVGILLKEGVRSGGLSQLVFATERVAWFPKQESSSLHVTAAHVFLARLGFDVGLLDDVRAENKKPLSLADRDSFYQLLAAVRSADRSAFTGQSPQPLEVVPLLVDPTAHQGHLFTVEGIARRAVKVRVGDADIQKRFGIDHYYQIDLFVDLNKQVIKLGKDQPGKETAVFENSYPVTVCVPSLPAELAESDRIREHVRVPGVFFKLWSYSSEYVSAFDKDLLQISPMLIGVEPRVIPPVLFRWGIGYVLAAAIGLALLGIWLGLRRRGFRAILGKAAAARGDGDSAEVDGATTLPERPDFTNLK